MTKPSRLEDSLFLARYLVLDVASQLYITLIGNREAAPYLYVNLVGIRRHNNGALLGHQQTNIGSVVVSVTFSVFAQCQGIGCAGRKHGLRVLPSRPYSELTTLLAFFKNGYIVVLVLVGWHVRVLVSFLFRTLDIDDVMC